MITVLARPDPDGVFRAGDEYLAIPDVAGLRRCRRSASPRRPRGVGHDHLDLDLRTKPIVYSPRDTSPLALLAAKNADLGHRHADDPGLVNAS